jgi:hypothetical protein
MDKLDREAAGELLREDALFRNHVSIEPDEPSPIDAKKDTVSFDAALPEGIKIIEAEAIVDRKSIFVGRACRISDPSQVL